MFFVGGCEAKESAWEMGQLWQEEERELRGVVGHKGVQLLGEEVWREKAVLNEA